MSTDSHISYSLGGAHLALNIGAAHFIFFLDELDEPYKDLKDVGLAPAHFDIDPKEPTIII